MIVSGGFLWFGFTSVISSSSSGAQFRGWQRPSSGLVETFDQLNQSLTAHSSALNSTSFIVWSRPLPKVNSSSFQRLSAIENSSLVVYEINGGEPESFIYTVARLGFEGIFLSGNPGDYNATQLKLLANATTRMGGFLVVNKSLAGIVQGVSSPSAYYIYQPSYKTWTDFIRQSNSTGTSYKNDWVNIQKVDQSYLADAVKTFQVLGVSYFSLDFGNMSYAQTKQVIALESSSGPGPGIVPSAWHVTDTNAASNEPIVNGTLYTLVSNIPLYTALENSTGPGNFTFFVRGINTTYGYVSYISQNYTTYTSLNSTFLFESEAVILVRGTDICVAIIADYTGFNHTFEGELLITRAVFGTINGTLTSENTSEIPIPGGDNFSFISVTGRFLLLFGQYSSYYGQNQYFYEIYNVTTIDLISGKTVGTTQFVPPPANIGPVMSEGTFDTTISGNLLIFTVTYDGNYSITYSSLVFLPDNRTLFVLTNESLGTNFYEASGNLYYTSHNQSGGTDINEISLTTFRKTTLFTTSVGPVVSLFFLGSNFLIYTNRSIISLSQAGREIWNTSLPELEPAGLGYYSATPVLIDKGNLLVGSVILAEGITYNPYSQEFEIVNFSTGHVVSRYYNNFTLIPVGNPPIALPPSPDVYQTVTWAGNVLIYSTLYGPPEIFGAYL